MNDKELLVNVENEIAILTINRPEVLNAVSDDTCKKINDALTMAESDDSIKAIIITGSGDKAFCTGHDISTFNSLTIPAARESSIANHNLCTRIQYFKKPIIAAINGYAMGAGFEIALSCDFRIASHNAVFGFPEVKLGIFPGQGGTQRLTRIAGMGPAKYYIMTAENMTVERAYQLGIVEKTTTQEELMKVCKKSIERVLRGAPLSVSYVKDAINYGIDMDLHSALKYESEAFLTVFSTEDRVEGVNAFLEKRRPSFKGK